MNSSAKTALGRYLIRLKVDLKELDTRLQYIKGVKDIQAPYDKSHNTLIEEIHQTIKHAFTNIAHLHVLLDKPYDLGHEGEVLKIAHMNLGRLPTFTEGCRLDVDDELGKIEEALAVINTSVTHVEGAISG